MSRTDQLLREFIGEYRSAGDADPRPYLARVTGLERAELAALIDGFLATAPPPEFDAEAFAQFRADSQRAALVDDLVTPQGLGDLRRIAGLEKADVGTRLAEHFGFPGRAASAKACYHEIETGQVPPARVQQRVWEALSELFGRGPALVREAAAAAFESRAETSVAFTRPGSGPELTHEWAWRPAGFVEPDPVRAAFFLDAD